MEDEYPEDKRETRVSREEKGEEALRKRTTERSIATFFLELEKFRRWKEELSRAKREPAHYQVIADTKYRR